MKKIKSFNEVPFFTDNQINKQLEKQVRFLRAVYPFLDDFDSWNEGAIELRPLKRDNDIEEYVRSFNAWHMRERDQEHLNNYLKLLNGKGYCSYYSVFAFDFDKEVFKADGGLYQKGKINKGNALFTTILPMDFDDITYGEFKREKKKLARLGIETIDIFTGHGFQSIILLDKKVYDKDILKKFTNLMISKGFRVDESIIDSARVLRMPYSFNCKAFDKKSKHYDESFPEIIATTDYSWTDKRYGLVEVFEKIGQLPDIIPEEEPLTSMDIGLIPTKPIHSGTKEKTRVIDIEEVKDVKMTSLKEIYNMLDIDKLPDPVKKMLQGSKSGLRNSVMLFLIPFWRNSYGLDIETIKEIMVLWGEECSPKLTERFVRKEVDRIYGYGLRSKHGAYTKELRAAYGYLDFSSYTRKNKIKIPNAVFEDFDVISDGSIRIYFALQLSRVTKEKTNFTRKEIEEIADISKATFFRNIKDLLAMGHISKSKGKEVGSQEYEYYLHPYPSAVEGFTMIDTLLIRQMLKELTNGEIKLYSYICKMISNSCNDCWASQKYLAKKIGRSGHSSISKMTDSLMEKEFINKKTEEKNGRSYSIYNLNF